MSSHRTRPAHGRSRSPFPQTALNACGVQTAARWACRPSLGAVWAGKRVRTVHHEASLFGCRCSFRLGTRSDERKQLLLAGIFGAGCGQRGEVKHSTRVHKATMGGLITCTAQACNHLHGQAECGHDLPLRAHSEARRRRQRPQQRTTTWTWAFAGSHLCSSARQTVAKATAVFPCPVGMATAAHFRAQAC